MGSMRALPGGLPAVLLALSVLAGIVAPLHAAAQDKPTPQEKSTPPKAEAPADSSATSLAPGRPPDQIMASVNRALNWYRQARIVMRSVEGSGVFGQADQQTALRLLGRAFDVARAEAALLRRDNADKSGAGNRRAEEQKKLEASVRQEERDVERLRALLRDEPERRAALTRQLVAAQNRLELDRARLDFFAQLREVTASRVTDDDDLEHQIDALKESAPELSGATGGPAVAVAPAGPTSGTWGMIQRLLALQRSRGRLGELETSTNELVKQLEEDGKTARASLRPILARLTALAKDPTDAGKSLADSQREFRELLERRKLLVAIVLPLREQAALARRYASDLRGWDDVVNRQSWQVLQGLALDLVGVIVALAIILICGVLWRMAVMRYVVDGPRRRLLLTTRSVVITLAVALVLIFHFTSEMAALVTALGFAAAGIAFALQNVILAVAGYFTMVAPNGIRVGDRVSLQGPFGYVHGEVAEIGFVRIKLLELAGEPLKPTGRVVVFPNSVVFTGSFFKDPAQAS
jgi:hypothetical protein